MNKCPNCSFDVKPGDVFCRNCGSKLPIPQNNFSNSMQPQTINNINSVNNVINQVFMLLMLFSREETDVPGAGDDHGIKRGLLCFVRLFRIPAHDVP